MLRFTRMPSRGLLIALILPLLGCSICAPLSDPFSNILVSERFISRMTLYDGSLYFGAGHCLYRISVEDAGLHEITCSQSAVFHRPAIDGECAYAQTLDLVDLSVLALTGGDRGISLLDRFYYQRGVGIQTSASLIL